MPKTPNNTYNTDNNPDIVSEMFESDELLCIYNYRPKEDKLPSVWITVPPQKEEARGSLAGGHFSPKTVDDLAVFLMQVNSRAREDVV